MWDSVSCGKVFDGKENWYFTVCNPLYSPFQIECAAYKESLTAISDITASKFYQNSAHSVLRYAELSSALWWFGMKHALCDCTLQFSTYNFASAAASGFITSYKLKNRVWKNYSKAYASMRKFNVQNCTFLYFYIQIYYFRKSILF